MSVLSRRGFLALLAGICCVANPLMALDVKGIDYMSISELARVCGMRYTALGKTKSQSVFSNTLKMSFELHSRKMELNGRILYLGHAVAKNKNMLYISRRDFRKTILPIIYPKKNGTPPKLFHIVIDAGHGGKDVGAQNKRLKAVEKNINLDIALKIGRELKKNGYKVSYTRTKDRFLELPQRAKAANSGKADLFLSIHCNAAGASVSGLETFALTPRWMPSTSSSKRAKSDNIEHNGNANDEWNQLLAYYIQDSMLRSTKAEDRGVKRARFVVLREVKMPAALIECGFISNNAECANLMSAKYRQKLAQTIASGVIRYHNTLRRLRSKR